jgi:hypothetical protein
VQALAAGKRVAVYCSDVSGAFDRVDAERLVDKLEAKKLHPKLIAVITSWLRQRTSNVLVGGAHSVEMPLKNMVFQGTVLGPTLWNLFFEDARLAINEYFFTEVVYADDLNAFRIFGKGAKTESIQRSMKHCQHELHTWGNANQVIFDASKESQHILCLSRPVGDTFKMLGLTFDGTLSMDAAIAELVTDAGWKLRTLLRTRRYYSDADLIMLYKAHLLSYIEYRTPAIYHALRKELQKVDAIQDRFLRDAGVSTEEALMHFNLAPLSMRRDIAMLGMLHRAKLGIGPPQLREVFKKMPGGFMLIDPYANSARPPLIRRSVWGLIPVYNLLGSEAQSIVTVADFQRYLQERAKRLVAAGGYEKWQMMYSPR